MFFVSRRHHEDVVREKDRQIDILAEQIDYLRLQLGTPTPRKAVNPTEQPEIGVESPYLSDEEEDLIHLHKTGQLTAVQLERALEEVGFMNTSIETL